MAMTSRQSWDRRTVCKKCLLLLYGSILQATQEAEARGSLDLKVEHSVDNVMKSYSKTTTNQPKQLGLFHHAQPKSLYSL
jgi:hypothetical protein